MSTQPQNSTTLTMGQALALQVKAGKLASFTLCRAAGPADYPVSLRAAVWLLQSLEGQLESYEPDAVAQGNAVRIEYQYGTHYAVLGTYSSYEIQGFLHGILHYCKRKWKQAERKVRYHERLRLAAKKGGASL